MTTGPLTYTASVPSRLDREAFVATFGGVYEHSPWIAEAAWDAGLTPAHDDARSLHAVLSAIVDAAGREAQLALLRAHPDLAGKLAVRGELTAESTGEQASAGLDQCTPDEFEAFQSLNERYKENFGFPYILAVKGRNRAEILENFQSRIDNAPEVEFAEALAQVHRIAELRLNDIE